VIYVLSLTPFTVIVASRPVNKNVSTGAVIRAKQGTEPGVHKLLANYQTGFGYKFRPTIGLSTSRSFMNAPETKSTQAWRA